MCIKQARNPGFTLPELMITLAIAGILMAVAIPSFNISIRNSRLSAYSNDLISSMNLARTEAVKRGQQVVVRQNGGGWQNGWQIFVDVDRTPGNDNIFNDDGNATLCEVTEDCLLRSYPAISASYTVTGNGFANFIRYRPDGSSSTFGNFVICDIRNGNYVQANTSRLIIVNSMGRVRMGADADNDGFPERDDGSEILSCL